MRWLIVALACMSACGSRARQPPPGLAIDEPQEEQHVTIEWKVEQGDGNTVNVSLVVDGRSIAIGALDAATEHEAGTPATCALRAAGPRRTELVCGDANAYVADLVERELVVSLVGDQRTEVRRIPVDGDVLAIKMLLLPGSKP